MKLVEILAKHLEEWPKDIDGLPAKFITQDGSRHINISDDIYVERRDLGFMINDDSWSGEGLHFSNTVKPFYLARDYQTAIVTKADWELEKLRQVDAEQEVPLSAEQIVSRVKEIDTLQKEMQNERETLLKQLAEKGLALITVKNQEVDVSHWLEWKAGDFVKVVSSIVSHHRITLGTIAPIDEIDENDEVLRFIVCGENVSPNELIRLGRL